MFRIPIKTLPVMALLLAACAAPPARSPISTTAPQMQSPLPAATSAPPAAARNIVTMLRGWLNAPDAAINLISAEPQEWPNACLGLSVQGEMCAQVVTPGYKLTFEANGAQYVFHTDPEAYRYRVAAAPLPSIGEVLVTWTGQKTPEEGSCATTEIGTDALSISDCGGTPVQANFVREQNAQAMKNYAAGYVSFEADTQAGKVAFNGKGSAQPTPAEQRMIAELADLMYREAIMGRPGASWANAVALQREGSLPACINVLTTGEVNVNSCQPDDAGISTRLNPSGLDQLYRWLDTFSAFEYAVDGADKITMQFTGRGSSPATAEDMQAVHTFVESLIGEVREANPVPDAVPIALPVMMPEGLDWVPAISSASAVSYTARAEDPSNREFRWVEVRGALEAMPQPNAQGTAVQLRGQTGQIYNFGEGHVVMWQEDNTQYAVWSSFNPTETVQIAGGLVPMSYEMFNQLMRERAQQQSNAGSIEMQVQQALNARDYDALQALMADPFVIGYWQSEGVTLTPARAIEELRTNLLTPDASLQFLGAEALATIQLPTELEPGVSFAGATVVRGMGPESKGEALLIFGRDSAGRDFWHSMIYAMNGFEN